MAPKRSYDDLETDYLEEENESGFLSLISVIIAFVAVAVFIALAWYAYQSNTGSSNEEIEVVYPEEGPVREAPEESGGWQFPHQDKSVYGMVSDKTGSAAEVEQILPAPEQPVDRPEAETKVWMNDKLKAEPIEQTDAERQLEAKALEAKAEAKPTVPEVQEPPQEEKAPEVTEVKKAEPAPVTPRVEVAAPPKPKKAPVVATPVASPAPPKAVGNIALQLGAVRSEADAKAQWGRLRGKYSLLGNKTLKVQSADIPGKGTSYRIQAAGFATRAEAAAACSKLSSAGQACFVVGR